MSFPEAGASNTDHRLKQADCPVGLDAVGARCVRAVDCEAVSRSGDRIKVTVELVVSALVPVCNQKTGRKNDAKEYVRRECTFEAKGPALGGLDTGDEVRGITVKQLDCDVGEAWFVCILNTITVQVVPNKATDGS